MATPHHSYSRARSVARSDRLEVRAPIGSHRKLSRCWARSSASATYCSTDLHDSIDDVRRRAATFGDVRRRADELVVLLRERTALAAFARAPDLGPRALDAVAKLDLEVFVRHPFGLLDQTTQRATENSHARDDCDGPGEDF